jgi:hypothetical protein
MLARVQASFDRQGMMSTLGVEVTAVQPLVVCRGEAFADGDKRPFAVMQATMTAVFGRPGISG